MPILLELARDLLTAASKKSILITNTFEFYGEAIPVMKKIMQYELATYDLECKLARAAIIEELELEVSRASARYLHALERTLGVSLVQEPRPVLQEAA